MFISRWTREIGSDPPTRGPRRGSAAALLAVVPLLLVTVAPASVEAGFWDKLKAATQKSLQRQGSRQQQQQGTSPATAGRPAATPRPAQAHDIRGISLGMGLAETEAALRELYPDYHVVPINYDSYGRRWTGVLAAMPKAKHKDEVVLVDFTQPPAAQTVIAVTRYKEFPADATPSLENVEGSLQEKYGPWAKGEATTRGGYRKLYGWWGNPSPRSCVDEKLSATFGRLHKIVEEDGLSRVLGDAYGDPAQYVTPFRDYVNLDPQTATCGKQVSVELGYRPDQHLSPVNRMVAVVADFEAYHASEVAFSKLATEYRRQQATGAVRRGGKPDL